MENLTTWLQKIIYNGHTRWHVFGHLCTGSRSLD